MILRVLGTKLKEVLLAVLPITGMVLLLHFTLVPLDSSLLIRFLIGSVLIVIGLAIFLFGVDIGITPIGQAMGTAITKTNLLWVVIAAGFVLGFFVSMAEPDLHILAGQVDTVTGGLIAKGSLVAVVSTGIAGLVAVGLVRVVYNVPLYKILTVLYGLIFLFSLFTSREFLAISFDASGATTGAMTVPFLLALSLGVTAMKKDSKAQEKDSFGLVAIASTGAVLSVMLMSIVRKAGPIAGSLTYEDTRVLPVLAPFLSRLPKLTAEVLLALLPILLMFLVLRLAMSGISRREGRRIPFGLLFTFIGLLLFLLGVNGGFMDVGVTVGRRLASLPWRGMVVLAGFLLGFVTVLAEPAVHVLTHQIEEVTAGYVRRRVVLATLAVGIGLAVALSIWRIMVPGIHLWHVLLPGYLAAVGLMYLSPKLFVGIAYDAGGVASGPMTATFILAFAHGAADAAKGADVLVDGFGMIAMVALMPLITLQILGFLYRMKSGKGMG